MLTKNQHQQYNLFSGAGVRLRSFDRTIAEAGLTPRYTIEI